VGGDPHWCFVMEPLGEDWYGVWLSAAAGMEVTRPGASFTTNRDVVMLFPRAGPYTVMFNAEAKFGPSHDVALHVDITTVPE